MALGAVCLTHAWSIWQSAGRAPYSLWETVFQTRATPELPANGAISSLVKVQLIANPRQILLIAAALFLSIKAAAVSALLTSAVKLMPIHRASYRLTHFSVRDLFIVLIPDLAAAALALTTPALLLSWANAEKLPCLWIFYLSHP